MAAPGGQSSLTSTLVVFGVGAVVFALIGAFAPQAFLGHFTVFVLACFVGYMVVWNVTPGAAYAVDERDQRDFSRSSPSARWFRSRRLLRAGRPAELILLARRRRRRAHRRSTCSAVSR